MKKRKNIDPRSLAVPPREDVLHRQVVDFLTVALPPWWPAPDAAAVIATFFEYVDREGGPARCWPWQGATNRRDGYGVLSLHAYHAGKRKTRRIYVHRLALAIDGRAPSPRERARHDCDFPPCANPRHLLKGTQADNVRDAMRRGRHKPPPRKNWRQRTEPHHWQRLTEEQAKEIKRRALAGEKQALIARDFGINAKTVSKIKLGQRWPHLCAD